MILKGSGVSSGIITGRVRKIRSYKDVLRVGNGDVVVTNNNSPLFSLAFLKAGAIISEKGGLLSHLAIVAREMSKPCVFNVKNALELLKSNEIIEVNGTKGEICTGKKNERRKNKNGV